MNDQIPPDWYTDPFARFERRYWDGAQWTQHVVTQGRQDSDPATPAAPTRDAARATGTAVAQHGAQWHPDPFGRFESRYWDGRQWTHHVSQQGRQGVDPPVAAAIHEAPVVNSRIHRQVQRAGVVQQRYGGLTALFTEPVLVVNQKAKLFGADAEYHVHDERGRRIGFVREVDQRLLRKAVGGGGANSSHRYQVVDDTGTAVISLHRPAKFMKSTLKVVGTNGTQGEIVQKTIGFIGNVRFDLESGGQVVGSMHAESSRAWDFNIQTPAGEEVARITKTWAGWAKERFTRADNYVVQIHRPLEEPLRTLVVAAALAVDTALKEGNPTNKGTDRRSKRRYN